MRPLLALLLASSCLRASPPPPVSPVDVAAARARGARPLVPWRAWDAGAFAAARADAKLVLVDGAAAWCHWCHVMDATTYADPAVAARIAARFVPVRFDAEERLDLTARYREWGWPATAVLTADGVELVRHRGYLAPDALLRLLDEALARPTSPAAPPTVAPEAPLDDALLVTAGPWIARQLDAAYDRAEGSWGTQQKLAIGAAVSFELRRAAHGDDGARERATQTLRAQRAIYDPVWGGVYQYSAGSTWRDPHFEKLMTWQAPTIEALAEAHRALGGPQHLADARAIAGYVTRFLRDGRGAFLATQDADVNGHDPSGPFVDGHVFYAADDAGRRRLGMPRVDPRVYARENGLALAALAALHEASPSPDALAAAQAAAELLARTHLRDDGAVLHEEGAAVMRYLADAAALGRGYARLAEALPPGDAARARHVERATRIGREMLRAFGDAGGALRGHTTEAGAPDAGDTPEEENILAARFLAALARVTGDGQWRERARGVLAVMALPAHAAARGRFVGDLLLALDECGLWPWDALSPGAFVRTEGHATLAARLDAGGLVVTVTPRDGLHVNTAFPAALSLEASGAAVPATLRRADAARVADEALVFRVAVAAPSGAAVRGVVRFALCGEASCDAEARGFVVAAR